MDDNMMVINELEKKEDKYKNIELEPGEIIYISKYVKNTTLEALKEFEKEIRKDIRGLKL